MRNYRMLFKTFKRLQILALNLQYKIIKQYFNCLLK